MLELQLPNLTDCYGQAELGMMRCNAIGGVLDFSPKQQWLDQIIQSHGFETCGSGARCLASKSQLLYT